VHKILIVGDSISMGYTPTVAAELADVAEVVHHPGNGTDSSNVISGIGEWIAEARPDVVTLNCGLHDIKREKTNRLCQVPLDFYKMILPIVIDKIRSAGCRAVWVNTTPVIEKRHQAVKPFDRYNKDVDAYNKAAKDVAQKAGLPVINLHKAAGDLGLETALADDGVHFTADAYEALGKKVAARLREMLQ